MNTRQLQQYTHNYNNTHKTTTTVHTRQLQQYTQDNFNSTHTTTTIHTRQLQNTHKTATIVHTRQLQQYTQDNYNNSHKTTTTIHTRQLQQYTHDNYNNTHKTATAVQTRQLQQYTQDNYNNTHKTTTTVHTRQLQQYTQDNYNNTHQTMFVHVVAQCILVVLIPLFVQLMHTNYNKIVKQLTSFKIITVAPTCFGLHKPSSGSSQPVSLKLQSAQRTIRTHNRVKSNWLFIFDSFLYVDLLNINFTLNINDCPFIADRTNYAATIPITSSKDICNRSQHCNFSEAQTELPDDGLCKPKHVGAIIIILNYITSLTIF